MSYLITIGDWSQDGHGAYDIVTYEANRGLIEQRAAYLRAVETTGLAFHDRDLAIFDPHDICTRASESAITGFQIEVARRHGVPSLARLQPGSRLTSVDFSKLILDFIRGSLRGFSYEVHGVREPTNIDTFGALNGWSSDLQSAFGYGLKDSLAPRVDWEGAIHMPLATPELNSLPKVWHPEARDVPSAWEVFRHFPYDVTVDSARVEDVAAWAYEVARDRIAIVGSRVFFRDESDMTAWSQKGS